MLPTLGLTLHVTFVFADPVTVAVNGWVSEAYKDAEAGVKAWSNLVSSGL
jgi:hypothetical protein